MEQSQELDRLFEEREKEIKTKIINEVEMITEREIKLLEFELFYSLLLKNNESAEWVQNKRKDDWEKALKETGGNWEKAMTIFSS